MALEVIGAGFGRTGTESLKTALEQLGFSPCHHMVEVLPNPDQMAFWRASPQQSSPDWDYAYAGYKAAVDWPTAYYWRELTAYYPAAKVILTVRDPDQWYGSFSKTILPMLRNARDKDPESIGNTLLCQGVFQGELEDRNHIIDTYLEHIETVKASVPAQRLLVYRTGSGWGALCEFLGLEEPTNPYPSTNQSAGFKDKISTLLKQGEAGTEPG